MVTLPETGEGRGIRNKSKSSIPQQFHSGQSCNKIANAETETSNMGTHAVSGRCVPSPWGELFPESQLEDPEPSFNDAN